jgi:hypothetical protein
MQVTDTAGYAISIPGDWYPLPGLTATDEALTELVSSFALPEEPRGRLLYALENVQRVVMRAEGRTNWAMIRDARSGRVDAIMAMSFPRQTSESLADYRRAADSVQPNPELEQVERTVTEFTLNAGTAIVVHEFVLPRTDGGVSDPAVERAVVGVFPTGFDSFVEFALTTQDLGVFDDAGEYLLSVAARIHLSPEPSNAEPSSAEEPTE